MSFKLNRFTRSLSHAIRGFKYALEEQNFKIQVVAAMFVVFFALLFGIKAWEMVVLLMMIVLVLVLEIINSIFERIVDILEPRVHPYAKIIKDMMASAVLVASLGSVFVGAIVFLPYIKKIISSL